MGPTLLEQGMHATEERKPKGHCSEGSSRQRPRGKRACKQMQAQSGGEECSIYFANVTSWSLKASEFITGSRDHDLFSAAEAHFWGTE